MSNVMDGIKQVYVIGCPRSGTRYTANVFRQAGYDVGHEVCRAFGTSDFAAVVRPIPNHAVVLHQVRHPLDVITSMQTCLPATLSRMMGWNAIRGDTYDPQRSVEVCARIWLFYNAQCESLAATTFRVEDEEDWRRACLTTGLPVVARKSVLNTLNTRKSEQKYRAIYADPVTWQRIETKAGRHVALAIARLARKYGYEV